MGVDLGGWSFGAQFADLNNDGFLDLYLVNGYVSASRSESYWYDFSKIAGGNQIVISDARNWPAMGTGASAGYQQKKVWINDGAGRFLDVAPDGRRHRPLRRPLGRARRPVEPRRARRDRRQPARAAAAVSQRGGARPRTGSASISRAAAVRTRRGRLHQPQRHRRPGHRLLERPAAGAGGLGRIGVLRAEPAPPALRPRDAARRSRRPSCAGRPARRRC